jgi:hypothetical protein
VFQNLQEVRAVVKHFVDTYDHEWLAGKKWLQNPWQASMARPGG